MKGDRGPEVNPNFVPPPERPVQPGLGGFHPDGRSVVDVTEQVVELPGRIVVGPVDTTKQTLK